MVITDPILNHANLAMNDIELDQAKRNVFTFPPNGDSSIDMSR